MNSTAVEYKYCGPALNDFHTIYSNAHGYVSLVVCIFGCIANSLNIIVLTRREMRSPTNAILTGLAIADLLVMIDYIPYSIFEHLLPKIFDYSRKEKLSYRNAFIVLSHSIFAQVFHTVSIWLTVTLAVWRYIAVAYPQKNRLWCQMRTTLITIASAYIICPIIAIPIYLSYSITEVPFLLDDDGNKFIVNISAGEGHNTTLFIVGYSSLANQHPNLVTTNFWVYSVIIKIIPCLALTKLSIRLISALLEAKHRRKQLMGNSNNMKVMVDGKVEKKRKIMDKEKQTDRTTKMLLAVLLLFLLTEFPQGALGLLSATYGADFFMECYLKLGDLMDILALLNSAINFILYCSMSLQFRTTFSLLFRPKFLDRWLPVPQDGDEDNPRGRGKNDNGHSTHVTQISHV